MFERGVSPPVVAGRLRVSRKSAYAWHAAWREGGAGALRSKGPSGRPSRMKPAWRAWLATALEQGPAAHGWVEDQRWTLPRIALLVARRFHVRFSHSQISRILHEMDFSVQVPVHRAAERDPQAVRRWMREVWPEVEKAVREQGSWLVFEDEAGQSLRPPKARTWSRRGHTPVVKVTGRGSGRVSLAALVCAGPGRRSRLIYRMLVHTGRKGEKKGFVRTTSPLSWTPPTSSSTGRSSWCGTTPPSTRTP